VSIVFYVLFLCKCVLYYCHGLSTQLHSTNISLSFIVRITETLQYTVSAEWFQWLVGDIPKVTQ